MVLNLAARGNDHAFHTRVPLRLFLVNVLLFAARPVDDSAIVDKSEVKITYPVPVTKVYVDEDVVIVGFADGTMKLYDRESRLFLSQLNVIPVAARGNADATNGSSGTSSELTRAPAYMQHKISFLARQDEMVISAMLDPSAQLSSHRQLEISIWPLRALNAVQPLKNKLLPGNVHFINFDRREGLLIALAQDYPVSPGSPGSSHNSHGHSYSSPSAMRNPGSSMNGRELPAQLSIIANSGPLIALSWIPPFKSLMMDGLKWRESNDQQQAKLAQEVMEQVLLEASFFRAMFMVDADSEEVEHVVSSMFSCLAGKDAVAAQFIETAIDAEIVLRRGATSNSNTPSPHASSASIPASNASSAGKEPTNNSTSVSPTGSNSASPEPSRAAGPTKRNSATGVVATNGALKASSDSTNTSVLGASSASLASSKEGIGAHRGDVRESSGSVGGSSPSGDSSSAQYFPPHAMTTTVITSVLQEMCAPYLESVLLKPLSILNAKGTAAHMIFSLPSTHAAPEDQPMFGALIKVTASIVDGLVEHQSKLPLPAHKMLVAIHQAVCADNASDSELRSFRRGSARVFLDYVLLKTWLDPVGAQLVTRVSNEMRHNLRIVAQLLQVICGYSKHKLTDPTLCSLVTEYSTKWRSWLLSKVSDTSVAPAARLPLLDRAQHDAKFDGRYDYESGIFGSSPKTKRGEKEKDKRSKIGRGTSFIAAPKITNAKAAAMVVTKYIITHAAALLEVMNRGRGRTPDPTAIRIRALADSLVMPIMTMMAKQGTKDVQLAAALRVMGKNGQGTNASIPSESSRSSGTASSSESVSSESYGNKDAIAASSSPHTQRSATTSTQLSATPTKTRRRGSDRKAKRSHNSNSNSLSEDKSKSVDRERGEQDGSGSDRENSSPRRARKVVTPGPTVIYIPEQFSSSEKFGSSESRSLASDSENSGNPSETSPSHSPHLSTASNPSQRSVSPRKTTKKKKSGAALAVPGDDSTSNSGASTPSESPHLTPTVHRPRKLTDGTPLSDDNKSISREASPIRPGMTTSISPSRPSPKVSTKKSVSRKTSAELKPEETK